VTAFAVVLFSQRRSSLNLVTPRHNHRRSDRRGESLSRLPGHRVVEMNVDV